MTPVSHFDAALQAFCTPDVRGVLTPVPLFTKA